MMTLRFHFAAVFLCLLPLLVPFNQAEEDGEKGKEEENDGRFHGEFAEPRLLSSDRDPRLLGFNASSFNNSTQQALMAGALLFLGFNAVVATLVLDGGEERRGGYQTDFDYGSEYSHHQSQRGVGQRGYFDYFRKKR